jgi:hypothetical protein
VTHPAKTSVEPSKRKKTIEIRKAARKYRKKGLSYKQIYAHLKTDHGITMLSEKSVSNYFRKPKPDQQPKSKTSKPGRKEVLTDLTKEVLYAAAIISRYNTKRLVEQIQPFYNLLQGNPRGEEKLCKRTATRFLRGAGILKDYATINEWPAGTVVLHSTPIQWQQTGRDKLHTGTLLCIAERHTGFTYFVAYSQIKAGSLYHQIKVFAEHYQADITKIVMVTERLKTKAEDKRIATVIGISYKLLLKQLRQDKTDDAADIKIHVSPAVPRRTTRLFIPGDFTDRDSLNSFLRTASDLYNKTSGPTQACPRDKVWKLLQEMNYKNFTGRRTAIDRSRFAPGS